MRLKSYQVLFLLLMLVLSNSILAEGGAHHEPSVWDLKYPALNFVLLFGFLIYKLKAPLKNMFDKNAESIKSMMESAEKQSKDAEQKLAEVNLKLSKLEEEKSKIASDYKSDLSHFEKTQKEELLETSKRMSKDVESKISGEEKELSDKLNTEVLDLLVQKTQATIKGNAELKNKATKNIFAGMN